MTLIQREIERWHLPAAAAAAASAPAVLAPACVLPEAAAARNQAQAIGLADAVDAWANAARGADNAQGEADQLCDAVRDSQAAVEERRSAIADLRSKNAELKSEIATAADGLNDRVARLVEVHRETATRLGEAVGDFAEALFWQTASNALETALHVGGVSNAGELSSHFAWVVKSYDRFLSDDLPRAVEFMSSQSSTVDLETYNRLTHLTEIYVADREQSMAMAQVESGAKALIGEFKGLGDAEVIARRRQANLDVFLKDAKNFVIKPLD
jgi:hypothetical protein